MKVYVVQADHWNVPGRPISAHASLALAEAEALRLVNMLRADAGMPSERLAWKAGLDGLKARLPALGFNSDDADIWISELDVAGLPAMAA